MDVPATLSAKTFTSSRRFRSLAHPYMSQKVKRGGTPTKAPLGYRNIRDYDDMGRRNSRIELDPKRAPLIKLAFNEYATNNWSLSSLAEHLSELGLTTLATPRLPAKPIDKKFLHNIFNNPYYKGVVTYNGVRYPGKHDPTIDEATWDKVQEILRSHVNGERKRTHEHYLKSTVYCGKCGARMIINNTKSASGDIYPYFICSAKHNHRNDCTQKALLIDEVAEKIEELYERITFTPEFGQLLQQWVTGQIDKLAEESKAEIERLKQQKDKLEREQLKLLQAHYADAIPLHLLKEEQERIGKALKNISYQMESFQAEYAEVRENLNDVFELLDDIGRAYRLADDFERRCFNQALFKKILVYEDLTLDVEYAEPFNKLLDPMVLELKGEYEKSIEDKKDGQPEAAAHLSFLDFLSSLTQTGRKILDFFGASWSKDVLVRVTGLEPAHPNGHKNLNLTRLPIPPHPRNRNRPLSIPPPFSILPHYTVMSRILWARQFSAGYAIIRRGRRPRRPVPLSASRSCRQIQVTGRQGHHSTMCNMSFRAQRRIFKTHQGDNREMLYIKKQPGGVPYDLSTKNCRTRGLGNFPRENDIPARRPRPYVPPGCAGSSPAVRKPGLPGC